MMDPGLHPPDQPSYSGTSQTAQALQAVTNASIQTTPTTGTASQRPLLQNGPKPHLRSANPSNIAPDPARVRARGKHSHGLSWSNSTRESLVDTLLTSLDSIPDPNMADIGARRAPVISSPIISHTRTRAGSQSSVPDHHDPAAGPTATDILLYNACDFPQGTRHATTRKVSHTRAHSDITPHESPLRSHPNKGSLAAIGQELDSILARGRSLHNLHSSPSAAAPEPRVPSGPGAKKERSLSTRKFYVTAGSVREKSPSARSEISQSVSSITPTKAYTATVKDITWGLIGGSPKQQVHSAATPARTPPRRKPRTDERSLRGVESPTRTPTKQRSRPVGFEEQAEDMVDGKRGFFKRTFISSSSRINLASPEQLARVASAEQTLQKRESSPAGATARELTKKTSAFFRRQKPSIPNTVDIPSLPPLEPTTSHDADSTGDGSLYKVMNPYLTADATHDGADLSHMRPGSSPASETTEDPDIFYTGYKPNPGAAIISMPKDATFIISTHDLDLATDELPLRNSSTTGRSDLDSSRAGSRAEPHALVSTVSSVYSTDLTPTDPDRSRSLSSTHDDNLRPLSSKGGIRHGLVVDTSSSRLGTREFGMSNNDPAERGLSGLGDLAEEEFVTPTAKEFPSQDGLGPAEIMQKSAGPVEDASPRDVSARSNIPPLSATSLVSPGFRPNGSSNAFSPSTDAARNMSTASTGTALTSDSALRESPTQEDRDRALAIFNGLEEPVPREQAASYLGTRKASCVKTLEAFMGLFNFKEQSILGGLRMLCNRLVLKAESQQVDRILDCFSSRWCQCNPNHGFQLKDVVHTICYSLLLLNTDLHMADIESKMTRAQFVKNALPTIKRVVAEAQPDAFAARPEFPWQESAMTVPSKNMEDDRRSISSRRSSLARRMSISLGMAKPEGMEMENDRPHLVQNSGSNALVSEKFDGKPAEWHYELEQVLKSFFNAIKNEALPLNQVSTLRRTNSRKSMRSMAPSEASGWSRRTDMIPGKRHLNRARSRFFAASTIGSSRASFDDGSSMHTPTGSSAWSKLSLGRGMRRPSVDTFATDIGPDQTFPQNIGFANALSQTIAREEGVEEDSMSVNPQKFLLDDDTLELAGAPWAKEGIVKYKHHLETTDKKAKSRDWNECFAVIERGYLRMFSFNSKGGKTGSLGVRKSAMHRSKAPSIALSVVGGGNWMQNAESLGSFLLRQTVASELPPPGYSKARPHVWALSLPNGAVHLFHVGTPQIAKEFVDTANYWSARLSKEPLAGGVENTEYGWSDNIMVPTMINPALVDSQSHARASTSASVSSRRPSIAHSSTRGSVDHGSHSRPGDRAHLEDWKPPAQSMMASQLMEVDQLQALIDYVASVEVELGKHNELRAQFANTFSPKSSNFARATANWEAKSSYLLRETIKFQTYIDALRLAAEERTRIDKERAEREAEKAEREKKKRERVAASTGAEGKGADVSIDAPVTA